MRAPGPLTDWARPFADLESCWHACPSPEWLLWLAARLSITAAERRALVSCLAELARRAARASRIADSSVARAIGAAEAWADTGAGLDDLLAAERAALSTAARAASLALGEAARARALFRSAPRTRPASFGISRALGVWAGWREARCTCRVALAAAATARAAAEAAWVDTVQADGAAVSPGESAILLEQWGNCVGESAGYLISALPGSKRAGDDSRAARKSARLVRRRVGCPRLD